MSIQSEINRLKQNVSNAFAAIGNKGGTVPSSKVSENLATAIQSIPTGVELNFQVVPNPKPSNPKENTIWVDTDVGIKSWKFCANKPTTTRFRYIKLQIDALDSGTSTIQLSEIRFVDDGGGFFVYPSGASASASISSVTTSEGADKLIDNNVETKFCSGKFTAGSYILIDLGQANAINIAKYKKWQWYTASDAATYPERNPKTFSLWGSNDGNAFELLDSVANYSAPAQNSAIAYTGTTYKTPENEPVYGDVLITIGTSSKLEFNAVKKNTLQVYPLSAYQYIDGSYVSVPYSMYKDGEWIEYCVEIFTQGKGSVIPVTAKERNAGKGIITVSNDGITVGHGSDWGGTDVYYYTDEPIDTTDLNSIKLTGQFSSIVTTSGTNVFHLTGFGLISAIPPVDGSWSDQNWVATTEIRETSDFSKEYEVPISNISGKYYFLFVAAGTKGTVTDIRIV